MWTVDSMHAIGLGSRAVGEVGVFESNRNAKRGQDEFRLEK